MKKSLMLFIGLVLSSHLHAKAGPSTGGGGFSVSCAATPVEPARTILLDLYEGAESFRFTMASASGSIEQDYFLGVKRTYELQGYPNLAETLKNEINQNLKLFFRSVKFIENSSELPTANDLGETIKLPSGCSLQQAAYFDDQNETVFILKPIWDKMDSLSQAALALHEIAFRDYRGLGDKHSMFARAFVAHVFSIGGVVPALDGVSAHSKRYSIDDSKASSFIVSNGTIMGKPIARIQFENIGGYAMLTKTWIDIPTPPWKLEKKSLSVFPYESCVVKTANVNQVSTLPINGTMAQGLSMMYEYKTGEPIRITVFKKDGTLVTSNVVSSGNHCQGSNVN